MKALVLKALAARYEGCSIADLPIPQPQAGEVLVRVRAAALNFPDLLMTAGGYQTQPALPFVLGSDVAGEVMEVGKDVAEFKPGDAVTGMRLGGAFAEFVTLPVAAVKRKPAHLDFSNAAAFGAAYYTAYVALVRKARLEPGEWLLVHGASGGIGLAAVDLGKILGARVIAASGSADKLAIVQREYSPEALVDTSRSFATQIKGITGDGANVIYDPVGGDVFDQSTRCIAFGGRLLIMGFTSGRIPDIKANIPLIKGFSIVGVRAGEHGRRFPAHGVADRAALQQLAEQGRIKPRVHAEYALSDWRAAFEAMERRRIVGRAILRPEAA
jgi:NADPH:quinone reductase